MKKIVLTTLLLCGLIATSVAQDKVWTMNDCMKFAVKNSPKVKMQLHKKSTYRAESISAIASFLPSIDGGVNAVYSFGRSIDPETNTYNNTSTFKNGYGIEASLPLFNGGVLINNFRSARVNQMIGAQEEKRVKEELILNAMEAYINVVYYRGTMTLAEEKLEESNKTLYKSRRMEELGLKGKADVAQIEAQVAEDDYNLTYQRNLYNSAQLTLKNYMNYPANEELQIDTLVAERMYVAINESAEDIYNYALETNPTAIQASLQVKNYHLLHLIAKGNQFPTISFSAGLNTNYYENLKSNVSPKPFKTQFENNVGKYLMFNLSIPIFDRLKRRTEVRRARNNYRIAKEEQTETLRTLQTAIEQAILDREGFAKETIQLDKQTKANQLAYQLAYRKYEEGLLSPIELQTNANLLIKSKANLLQKKLMYLLKCKLVDYYKGESLIEE